MLPRFQSLFLALMIALLVVFGTLGIYSVEASSFRATMHDGQAYEQRTTINAYDDGSDDTLTISAPGVPY